MKVTSRTLIGLLLVLLGLGYFFNSLNVFDFGSFIAQWWPIIVVVVGLIKFLNRDDSKIVSGLILLVGLFLLGDRLDLYNVDVWSLFWPAVLLIAGVSILSDQFGKPALSNERSVDLGAFFSTVEKRIGTDGFQGGKLTSVFGSIELDLRQAELLDDANITAFTGFGSIVIRVPRECEVMITGTPIFGGVEDHTKRENGDTVKSVLKLSYTTLFGSVEITN